MKSDKEFFELFRKNQYKLNERPSPKTWQRLEKRLDNHYQRQRFASRHTLSMVAALALLIVATFFLTIGPVASNEDYTTQFLEEVDQKAESDIQQLVDLSHRYQDRIREEIKEGDANKKLMPKVKGD